MKLLFENWREYLHEAAYGMNELPSDTGVRIELIGSDRAEISYVSDNPDSPIKGEIIIARPSEPCGDAWVMQWSKTVDGWGPFLYDIAIEWATWKGGGIVPDRGSVSKDARKIWKYYLNNRSDVQAHQLDDLNNTLTPEDEDNCDQSIATKSTAPVIGRFLSRDFASESNPMSKRYTKEPDVLQKLMDAGRLIQK
jgi:hypothetical protein